MTVAKTLILAAIFGGLAQTAVKPRHSSPPEKSATTITSAAESLFNEVQERVRTGLEQTSGARDLGSIKLGELVNLLDSCSTKLKQAGFEEKLNQAGRQAEVLQTQAFAVLKDPENKALLARDIQPEEYLKEINFQKARGVILTQKIQRLRNTVEEMRKYSHILEGAMPSAQLSQRLQARLSELVSEWKAEPQVRCVSEQIRRSELDEETLSTLSSNPVQSRSASIALRAENKSEPADRTFQKQIISNGTGFGFTGPAAKVITMSRQKAQEKSILRYVFRCPEPFGIATADQILKLRDERVSGAVIAAMLRHDDQLRATGSY
jgi:hypothetical protein